jgi:hypothetical protein
MMVSPGSFEKWALGYSGCVGGDPGCPSRRSIWVSGIEWGGGDDESSLLGQIATDVSLPPTGFSKWGDNLEYIFDRQVLKLLSATEGGVVADFRKFAELRNPFVVGGQGYFRLNLFPVSFRNTDPALWSTSFSRLSGFPCKEDYLRWCRERRLPTMRAWAKACAPRAIICLGKTFRDDFALAFASRDTQFSTVTIDGRDVSWAATPEKTLVAVLPFMVNRNGLVRNASIQKVGEFIRERMLELGN